VWAFDLLAHNGNDLRKWSLEAAQARLQALLSRFDCPEDGQRCPATEKHGLEGVVSKRRLRRIAPASAVTGARSKRRPGARPTGNAGEYLQRLADGFGLSPRRED
jgi:hypothetical protein